MRKRRAAAFLPGALLGLCCLILSAWPARTLERDETVVRFHCERGTAERTYVWDVEKEGRLLGMSMRGLGLRLRLHPSGERELFTWDGGLRPPKIVRLGKAGPDGGSSLTLGDSKIVAVR